jgi:class 3 adenylate cyclase/WD40 repeat protein
MSRGDAEPELLSFLIADIRGYTSFTHTRGDEAAALLAGKFARIAREGIEAHDGRLLELRGDEALAVFSSARASLRAAVALQQVFADETWLEPDLPLRVGIGLDAGEVLPVEGGYRGGALNLAARLCSLASAGESLASEGVTHLARAVDGLSISEWGTAEVKGLAAPVRAFSVTSTDVETLEPRPDLVTPGQLPAGLDSAVPMIGRDEQLRRLSWAWRVARRGVGGLVVVRGPAGIGKTRLLSALAEVAARGGGTVQPFALAAAEPDLEGLRKALAVDQPSLVLVDDVDAAAVPVAEVLAEVGPLGGRAVLVALALDEEHAPDEATRWVRRLDAVVDLRLDPLDLAAMRSVAALYLDGSVADLPTGVLESTGGVPRRLHQTVAGWLEDRAMRRLGVLASQAAGSRSEVATVESQLAGSVAELQQVRERTRLYGLGPGRHGPVPERSPYKGLDSFGPEDADAFFGREALVADLIARAAGGGLLTVVGASGSGKSSLVRAGLVPALAAGVLPDSQNWTTVVTRPGEHPGRALDVAVLSALPSAAASELTGEAPLLVQLAARDAGPQVLVVVDQAEELFTVCTNEAERAEFLAGLLAVADRPSGRVGVVLTVRADYYGRFAADQRLASALAANQVLVGPMSADEYRRTITRPAQRHGVTLEPELVDALVDEVTGEPGALPLLSTALVELWDARTDRTMTMSSYQVTGGLHAAVARMAESVYGGLDPDGQERARRIFLRLTGPGAGDTVVKRRVRLADLITDEHTSALVDHLATRRLLTIGDGAAEVAHEALLREWPRFQEWLADDREGIRVRAHLADAAEAWTGRGRDEGDLYRGARLSATMDWTTQHAQDLAPVEQEFITASNNEAQRVTSQQRRLNRRLRGLLIGVATLLVLALVAGVGALVQRQHARRETATAIKAETAAVARGAGADAAVTDDLPTALLKAVAAVRLAPSATSLGQLERVLGRHPELTHSGFMNGQVSSLATSPDGRTLAVRDVRGQVALFNAHTLTRRTLTQVGRRMSSQGPGRMTYSPDGATLAVTATPPHDPPLVLLNAHHLAPLEQQLRGWPDRTVRIDGVDYSTSGRRIAVSMDFRDQRGDTQESIVMVWDVSAPRSPVFRVRIPDIQGVAISPDGHTVYVANPFMAFDVDTGQKLLENQNVKSFVFFSLNPAGNRMLTMPYGDSDDDHALNLVSTRTGKIVGTAPALSGGDSFQTVTWASNGRRTAASTSDGKVVEWFKGIDLERTISNEDSSTLGLVFSPDGNTLYTGGAFGEVQAWDMEGYHSFVRRLRIEGPEVGAFDAQLSPDGSTVAYESDCLDQSRRPLHACDHVHVTLLRLSQATYESPVQIPGQGDFGASGWSPDSSRFVTGTHDGKLSLVDATKNILLATRRYHHGMITEAKFTADGDEIAVSFQGGYLLVVDATTLKPIRRPTRFNEPVLDVNTSPQNHTAFVLLGAPPTKWYGGTSSHEWALVNTDSGVVLRRGGLGIGDAIYSAFSPDGVHAVVVGNPAQVLVLDTRTGATTLGPSPPQKGEALWVGYNHDGSRFFVGTSDNSMRVYDATTGAELGYLPGDGQFGGFAPDGSVVVVNGNGDVHRWDPSPHAALSFACQAAGRDMTQVEWRANFGDRPFIRPCPGE